MRPDSKCRNFQQDSLFFGKNNRQALKIRPRLLGYLEYGGAPRSRGIDRLANRLGGQAVAETADRIEKGSLTGRHTGQLLTRSLTAHDLPYFIADILLLSRYFDPIQGASVLRRRSGAASDHLEHPVAPNDDLGFAESHFLQLGPGSLGFRQLAEGARAITIAPLLGPVVAQGGNTLENGDGLLLVALCMKKQGEVVNTLEMLEDIWDEYQVYENDEINYIDDSMKMRYTRLGEKNE